MAKATAEQIAKQRAKRDIKEIALLVLDKPLNDDDPMLDIEEVRSMAALTSANVDVKTRIIARMAGEALNGDIKAAEFVMKYSGNEPAKETNLNVNIPTFVDDMGNLDDDLNIVTVKKKSRKTKPEDPPTFVKD